MPQCLVLSQHRQVVADTEAVKLFKFFELCVLSPSAVDERNFCTFSFCAYLHYRPCSLTGAGDKYMMRNFIICTPRHYYWNGQSKEDEMGGECGTCGREEKCVR